nr:DNA helicase [Tanacetum cinerariifolium]
PKKTDKVYFIKGESRLDNCNVVPYNRMLGPDRIIAKVNRSIGDAFTSMGEKHIQVDEIQSYANDRFIFPFEACWRTFEFPIHSREPAIQILNIFSVTVLLHHEWHRTQDEVANTMRNFRGHDEDILNPEIVEVEFDEYISAEIPDPVKDPRGYKVVTELMMHGPCGVANLGASIFNPSGDVALDNATYNRPWPNTGSGEPDEGNDKDTSWITIPQQYCLTLGEQGLSKLIDFIYHDATLKATTASALQDKAIVYLNNDTADAVNAKILSTVKSAMKTYLSRDEAI